MQSCAWQGQTVHGCERILTVATGPATAICVGRCALHSYCTHPHAPQRRAAQRWALELLDR